MLLKRDVIVDTRLNAGVTFHGLLMLPRQSLPSGIGVYGESAI